MRTLHYSANTQSREPRLEQQLLSVHVHTTQIPVSVHDGAVFFDYDPISQRNNGVQVRSQDS